MGFETLVVSAATAALNQNLAAGAAWQKSDRVRRVRKIGVVGSTNPGDFKIKLCYGTRTVAICYNTTGGASKIPNKTDMMFISTEDYAAVNEDINIIVLDAANTNAVAICLDIAEVRSRPGY